MWEYINPVLEAAQGSIGTGQMIYRAWRYDPSFPGLPGKTLTPGDPLEKYPIIHAVDILPGSCGNPVTLISKGVLPVAILGSKDLDVTKIDPRSIQLEGFAPVRWSIEDVGAPGKCCGRDGYYDLVLKYDSAVVRAALANVPNRSETLLRLTGYSPAGWFLGKDKAFVMNNLFPCRPSRFKQY